MLDDDDAAAIVPGLVCIPENACGKDLIGDVTIIHPNTASYVNRHYKHLLGVLKEENAAYIEGLLPAVEDRDSPIIVSAAQKKVDKYYLLEKLLNL